MSQTTRRSSAEHKGNRRGVLPILHHERTSCIGDAVFRQRPFAYLAQTLRGASGAARKSFSNHLRLLPPDLKEGDTMREDRGL